jgi:hypothetical protein
MATTATTIFDDQAAGYDRYVRENWGKLESWERHCYQSFASDDADGKRIGRVRRAATGSGPVARTVSLAYLLMIAGLIFFPLVFQSTALALGMVNLGRGKTVHGVLQVGASVAFLGLYYFGFMTVQDSQVAFRDVLFGHR